MNNQLFWAKAHPDVIIPTKREEDGGYDLYARFDEPFICIPAHCTKLIPTDLHCAFSSDYVMKLMERGSTGTKGIAQRCGVIDSGFRGKIFVPITNTNKVPLAICKKGLEEHVAEILGEVIIYPYDKAICQAVMQINPKMDSKEITLEELLAIPSERGAGQIGSSGK